jgi:hypothetical protein
LCKELKTDCIPLKGQVKISVGREKVGYEKDFCACKEGVSFEVFKDPKGL